LSLQLFNLVYFKSTVYFFRYYNSWIGVAEALESETSSNETKSSTTEEKQKSAVEDSLMQFNVVVEAPSVLASVEDDGSWASTNRDISEQEENSFSSSSGEEIPEAKQSSNTTESSDSVMFDRNKESFASVVCIVFEVYTIMIIIAIIINIIHHHRNHHHRHLYHYDSFFATIITTIRPP
jgi:hypothetical protein